MTTESLKEQLRLPVIAAPMFLVSGNMLVKACCRAGIVGSFPALNLRSSEAFREWVIDIKSDIILAKSETPNQKVAPYAVNLIVHRSNPRLDADLKVCIEQKVPIVITSLGAVSEIVNAVHSYGGLVFHDVTNQRHAEKAAEAGVDGIIAVTAGAGGHAGSINPFALLAQVKEVFKKTIVLSGCISTGQDILAAKIMGADFAYMGTRFIATKESQAQDEYKQMILNCEAQDIIYTPQVSGVNANFMRPSLERAGFNNPKEKGHVDFGDKLTLDNEAKAWKNIWSAGHGVSAIHDILSVQALVDRLEQEYSQAFAENFT